jgi:hypothetical protein
MKMLNSQARNNLPSLFLALIALAPSCSKSSDQAVLVSNADTVRVISHHAAKNYGLTVEWLPTGTIVPVQTPANSKMVMVVIFRDFDAASAIPEDASHEMNIIGQMHRFGPDDEDKPIVMSEEEFRKSGGKLGLSVEAAPPGHELMATESFVKDSVADDVIQAAISQKAKAGCAYLLTTDNKYKYIRNVDLTLSDDQLAAAFLNDQQSHTVGTTPDATTTNQQIVAPTIDTFANWATFLANCSNRDDQVKALNKLLTFYDISGNTSISTEFTAPPGQYGERVKDAHGEKWTYPLGTIATVSISGVDVAPYPPLEAKVTAKVLMVGKRLMLFKAEDEQWYVSLDGNSIIPLIKPKETLMPPTSNDRNKIFLQKWRLSRFLKFRQEISDLSPTGSQVVSPDLCELMSELPVPESTNILFHIADKESRDAALRQWQKTMHMIDAKSAN